VKPVAGNRDTIAKWRAWGSGKDVLLQCCKLYATRAVEKDLHAFMMCAKGD